MDIVPQHIYSYNYKYDINKHTRACMHVYLPNENDPLANSRS